MSDSAWAELRREHRIPAGTAPSSIPTAPGNVAWRAGTHVPVADTLLDIVVAGDAIRCAAALAGYSALITPDSLVLEIELLRANTVFVAAHPSTMSGKLFASHVYDRGFRFLGSYLL